MVERFKPKTNGETGEGKFKGKKLYLAAILHMVPSYAVVPLILCISINCIVYFGTGLLTSTWKHYDLSISFDRVVPLLPAFVLIYLGCYIFWFLNYIIIMRQGKEYCMRFLTAEIMAKLVCGICFLLMPTTEVRPALVGHGFFVEILRFVYWIDAPVNLFPSIHCLVSWFCYIGLRGRKNIPRSYRIFSCAFAILVFISTQVTKQHYIEDVLAGIVIAEITFYLGFHTEWYRFLTRFCEWIWPMGKGGRDWKRKEKNC